MLKFFLFFLLLSSPLAHSGWSEDDGAARARLPKDITSFSKDGKGMEGGLASVKKYLAGGQLTDGDKTTLLRMLIWHVRSDGEMAGLDVILQTLLEGQPDNAILEGVTAVVLVAKQHGHPPQNGPALLKSVAAKASLNNSGSVFDLLETAYLRYPSLRTEPAKKISLPKSGVIRVGSVFTDEDKTKKRSFEIGTGNLVEIPSLSADHDFVITAAHLLGGSSPSIEINGKQIAVSQENIILDNDNDIAMIKVRKSKGDTALRYDAKDRSLRLQPQFQAAMNQNALPSVDIHYRKIKNRYFPIGTEPPMVMGDIHQRCRMPLADWAQERLGEEGYSDANRTREPAYINNGRQIQARAKTSPGSSGTFLTCTEGNETPEVKGILSQYNYFFRDSYFTSTPTIAALIDQFAQGKRGPQSATRWRMKNKLTFRDYGDGTLEANFIDRPAGEGLIIDPGEGVIIPPGEGVIIDPGLPCFPPIPADEGPFSKIPATAKAIDEHLALKTIFSKYGVKPGMVWRGKNVIGFKVISKKNPSEVFLIYANPQALQFMKDYEKSFTFTPMPEEADLGEFALKKLQHAFASSATQKIKADEADLKGTNPYYALGEQVRIEKDHRLYLRTIGDNGPDDYSEIILDKRGYLPGEKNFIPLVETKSKKTGDRYIIDLRQLYFTDLSQVAQQMNKRDELPADFETALKYANDTISVPYRNLTTGMERGPVFIPTDCSMSVTGKMDDNWLDRGRYSRSKCLGREEDDEDDKLNKQLGDLTSHQRRLKFGNWVEKIPD